MTQLVLVVPGRLDQRTGGYLYDRHIVDGLRARGRAVKVLELAPTGDRAALASVDDGCPTIIDGLALPGLEQQVAAHAERLRLVGMIHHPLAEETGLSETEAQRAARLEADLLPRLRGIICPSRRTAAGVAAYGVSAGRIAVVPPGTARPVICCRRRSGARALLCVASLVPRKGHCVLVTALAQLRDLDWRLLCVGSVDRDPATARAVRRLISATALGSRITLAGEWPPIKVSRAYQAADLFVLPSFHEGYGMAFAEAMAHGLPIVATAAGAIPETVPPQAGILVRPGDPAALARALRRLMAEPVLTAQLAAGSRAAGARLPDWRQTTEQWESALDRLAALDLPP